MVIGQWYSSLTPNWTTCAKYNFNVISDSNLLPKWAASWLLAKSRSKRIGRVRSFLAKAGTSRENQIRLSSLEKKCIKCQLILVNAGFTSPVFWSQAGCLFCDPKHPRYCLLTSHLAQIPVENHHISIFISPAPPAWCWHCPYSGAPILCWPALARQSRG